MSVTKEKFLEYVTEHKMTILQDNEVFRHLHFAKPGTSIYSFQITTFPGYLVITGDCGAYVFKRLPDMFDFFRCDELKINEGYWAEKLEAYDRRNGLRVFAEKKIKASLTEDFKRWLEESYLDEEDKQNAFDEFEEKIIDNCDDENSYNAYRGEITLDCGYDCEPHRYYAYEFDVNFLWCLFAIAWGIQQYDAAKKQEAK